MDEITLTNILNVISNKNPNINWRINCKYDNGEGKTLMEIKFVESYPERVKGRVTYDHFSGDVLRYKYTGFEESNSHVNIVDMLLDIMNHENVGELVYCN